MTKILKASRIIHIPEPKASPPILNVDCPVCGSKSIKRSSRRLLDSAKMYYMMCVNQGCRCVYSVYEAFDRFLTQTIDPAHVHAPVEAPDRPKNPVYTVRLE